MDTRTEKRTIENIVKFIKIYQNGMHFKELMQKEQQ